MTSLKVFLILAFVIFCQGYVNNRFYRSSIDLGNFQNKKKQVSLCLNLGSGDIQNDRRFNVRVAVIYLLSLSFFHPFFHGGRLFIHPFFHDGGITLRKHYIFYSRHARINIPSRNRFDIGRLHVNNAHKK